MQASWTFLFPTINVNDSVTKSKSIKKYSVPKNLNLQSECLMMLQCLEWEPSGSFYQSSVSKLGQNGAAGTSRISYVQDIANPTLQKNPRKVVLYRPSLTHFIARICYQPLPFQPGASFGAVIVGNAQSNSTLGSGLGLSYFPKAYDVVP